VLEKTDPWEKKGEGGKSLKEAKNTTKINGPPSNLSDCGKKSGWEPGWATSFGYGQKEKKKRTNASMGYGTKAKNGYRSWTRKNQYRVEPNPEKKTHGRNKTSRSECHQNKKRDCPPRKIRGEKKAPIVFLSRGDGDGTKFGRRLPGRGEMGTVRAGGVEKRKA